MNAIALQDFGKDGLINPRRPDFQKLLGEAAWLRLPAAVRNRFGVESHADAIYRGTCTVAASTSGRWFAQLCRVFGTPVAPFVGEDVQMTVHVIETPNGIVWERHYRFVGRAPVIVRSTKQLDADGTLVEALNAGLHMRLKVFEHQGELHFLSTGYFFRAVGLCMRLPDWFLPGETHVVHRDLGDGSFRFTMATKHHWFGRMFFQDGVFN